MHEHRLPPARHPAHAVGGEGVNVGRDDVGPDVISDLHIQQQQYHLHDGHLDSTAEGTVTR